MKDRIFEFTVEKSKSKIDWVDIFKGIAIILMVAGHAGSPMNVYIYLFHMPAFIFISGYTYNGKKYNLVDYIIKKVKTILLPMIIINVIFIILYDLANNIGIYKYIQKGQAINIFERLSLFFKYLGTPDLGGATWFLMVLFTVEIIFKLLCDVSDKFNLKSGNIIGCCLLTVIGCKLIRNGIQLPYLFDLSLFSCIFFAMGMKTREYSILEKYIDKKTMIPFSIITIIFLGSFYFKDRLPMNFPTRQFLSFPLNFLGAVCGIYLCYTVTRILEMSDFFKKIFIFIGRNTYCILVLHFFVFKCIFAMGIKFKIYPLDYLQELVPRYSAGLQWIIITVLSISLCTLISAISRKNKILNYVFNARLVTKKEKIINE